MSSKQHALFIPYMAIGHINPLLQLARRMSIKYDVTFIVSNARIQELRDRDLIHASDPLANSLIGLHDGISKENDKNVEASGFAETGELLAVAIKEIFRALPTRADPQQEPTKVLSRQIDKPVDILICDLFALLPSEIIQEKNIPLVVYNTSPGFVTYNKMNVNENTPIVPEEVFFTDWETAPDLHVAGIPKSWLQGTLPIPKIEKVAHSNIFNSLRELEEDTVEVMSDHPLTKGKPLWFIPPFQPEDFEEKPVESLVDKQIKTWLDTQEAGSVTYVSFGSMSIPVPEQIHEIGLALLKLNRPFIFSLQSDQHQHLPENFVKNAKKGLLLPWVPQRLILSHKSTRTFVTHCGWNSTLEAIYCGVPMVAWPMFGDQFGDAKLIEKLGIGLMVKESGQLYSRIVKADEIVELIEKVAGWTAGESASSMFADRAKEWREKAMSILQPGGSAVKDFDEFLNYNFF